MSEKRIPGFKEKIVVSSLDKTVNHNLETSPKLFEFEHDKRFVVRKAEEWLFEVGQYKGPQEEGRILKGLFDELRSEYGINAPVQFLVTENEENEPALYSLTDRISATDMEGLSDEKKQEVREGIRSIFASLVDYYEEKANSGGAFLSDLSTTEQFIYGTKPEETTTRWYLTDTDPFYSTDRETLFGCLEDLEDALIEIEQKFGISLEGEKERVGAVMKRLEDELHD